MRKIPSIMIYKIFFERNLCQTYSLNFFISLLVVASSYVTPMHLSSLEPTYLLNFESLGRCVNQKDAAHNLPVKSVKLVDCHFPTKGV